MRGRRLVAAGVAVLLFAAACGDDDATPEPEPPDAQGADYVALGDSFSAGGGAGPYQKAEPGCARSGAAWPYVLETAADSVDAVQLRACGGAKIDQLLDPWEQRGQPAQIPTTPDDRVRLVTLTIGGNDAGLLQAVASCAVLDCSKFPSSDQAKTVLAEILTRLADDVYPALRAAYPNARLVQVGYLRPTPPAGEPVQDCAWLTGAVRSGPVEIVAALNRVLKAATEQAAASDVTFVDVSDALAGHEMCTFNSWVHPLSDGIEALHPTKEGYKAIGEAVAAALDL